MSSIDGIQNVENKRIGDLSAVSVFKQGLLLPRLVGLGLGLVGLFVRKAKKSVLDSGPALSIMRCLLGVLVKVFSIAIHNLNLVPFFILYLTVIVLGS